MGLFDLFSTGPAENAAAAQVGGYEDAQKQANNLIDIGTNKGIGTLKPLNKQYNKILGKDMAGYNMYQNSLGLNGEAGNQQATDAFHTQPGYDFLQQQGEQAAMRHNASLGGLASGNTLTDLSNYDTGLADQSYQGWQNHLAGFQNSPLNDINAKAGNLTNMAGIYTNAAGQKAQNAYNSNVGIGEANAGAAMAPYNASANMWNTALGVGGLFGKLSGIGGFAPTSKV